MDPYRSSAVSTSDPLPRSIPLENNCALRPFPAGMPYALGGPVVMNPDQFRIPFFLVSQIESLEWLHCGRTIVLDRVCDRV